MSSLGRWNPCDDPALVCVELQDIQAGSTLLATGTLCADEEGLLRRRIVGIVSNILIFGVTLSIDGEKAGNLLVGACFAAGAYVPVNLELPFRRPPFAFRAVGSKGGNAHIGLWISTQPPQE